MRSAACKNLIVLLITACSPTGLARGQTSLDATLQILRSRYELPAVAAAVVVAGQVRAAGAVGVRRIGTNVRVTVNDRFHLGSDTKSMTALLAAMMVEERKLRWNSKIEDIFTELHGTGTAALGQVTLEQLLSHTSGIPADNDAFRALLIESQQQDGNLNEIRRWLVHKWNTQPLVSKPGSQFAYANMNYIIAGAMVESAAEQTWEELMVRRIFRPLQLPSAGLGPQSRPGRVDAPLGHLVLADGRVKAFLNGPNADNLAVIGPAGTAHMSVLDFARWAGWNAGEGIRGPALVRPETLKKLHTPVVSTGPRQPQPGTPPSGKYALGWGELAVSWAPTPLVYHGGSNEKNLAHVWIDLKRDLALVLVTNIGGKKAEEGLKAIAAELYPRFMPPG
jgi:CubicO group peptidase (beta-lactamase class C family)